MADSKVFNEIINWYDDQWRKNKRLDLSREIRSLMQFEKDKSRLFGLRHVLKFELVRHQNFAAIREVLEVEILENPLDGQARIELAEHVFYRENDPKRALDEINLAIPIATKSGEFIRNAVQVKARILRKLEDYGGLAECLTAIMKIKNVHPELDARKESDFLDGLPKATISERLLEKFDEYMSDNSKN